MWWCKHLSYYKISQQMLDFFKSKDGGENAANEVKENGSQKGVINCRIWGVFDYNFKFRTQGESLYQTSILYAEAANQSQPGFPMPINCKWFRYKNGRTYQIEEIHSNVYQLSAEDIGCKIKVEATPVDPDDGKGTAYGEFGPIELDPSARQTLEQVLGTGGSEFPVSIQLRPNESIEEAKDSDAKLYVNSHLIKIVFSGPSGEEVISFKYTIDYPRIELHPFDTHKFKIFYSDKSIDASYEFNRCIELKALSRQSRDLIALALKCFSAQTYFLNSKIIQSLSDEKADSDRKQASAFSVSEVLLDLEYIKKELYNQINYTRKLKQQKKTLRQQVTSIEEEMTLTIESYKQVLSNNENDLETDHGKAKHELQRMQKQIEELQLERQALMAQQVLWTDEKSLLEGKIAGAQGVEEQLRQQVESMSQHMGAPKAQVEQMRADLGTRDAKIAKLNKDLKAALQKLKTAESKNTSQRQLEQEMLKLKENLLQKEKEVVTLRRSSSSRNSIISSASSQRDLGELQEKLQKVSEENQALLLQRKTLAQSNESVRKELSRMLAQNEALQQDVQNVQKKHQGELSALSEEKELDLQRMKGANDRLMEEMQALEAEKEEMDTEKTQLVAQLDKQKDEHKQVVAAKLQEIDRIKHDFSVELEQAREKTKEAGIATKMLNMFDQAAKNSVECQTDVEPAPTNLIEYSVEETIHEEALEKMQGELQQSKQAAEALHRDLTLAQKESQKNQSIIQSQRSNLESLRKEVTLLQASTSDAAERDKSIESLRRELQVSQIESQENQSTIETLKALISEKESIIDHLQTEIEKLSQRLCEAQEALFELQASDFD